MPSAANSKVQKNFDYTSLDADTSHFVQQQTGEIKVLMKQTVKGILAIGLKLVEVKEKLRHGQFGDWLAAEFEWSQDTASNFMRVAQQFSNNPKISEFAPSALYLLAAPSTPELARVEAIARAESGEQITHKMAKALKQKYVSTSKKAELEAVSSAQQVPPSLPTSERALQQEPRSKPEILRIISRTENEARSDETQLIPAQAVVMDSALQPKIIVSTVEQAGNWWLLDKKHLLYDGDPNTDGFLQKVQQQVPLLFAFPSVNWQPLVYAQTSYIMSEQVMEKLLRKKGWEHLDELLESMIIDCSESQGIVVTCFLPSSIVAVMLNLINRLLRRGIIAEPDPQRCRHIINIWKKEGGKVEQIG